MILYIVFIALVFLPSFADADATLTNGIWTSTFNCSAQTSITADTADLCDGIDSTNYYGTNDAAPSSITSTSNYANGEGGLGFRHNLHVADRNDHSASMHVDFTSPLSGEVWLRWYQRTQPGTYWSAIYGHKVFYFYSSAGLWFTFDIPFGIGTGITGDTMGILTPGSDDYYIQSEGWYSIQGDSDTADGEWDCIELYMDIQMSGTLRIWVDGVLVHEDEAYNFLRGNYGTGAITGFDIGHNHHQAEHATTADVWEDFDDFAIATNVYAAFEQDQSGNNMVGPADWTGNESSGNFQGNWQ